MLIGNKKKFLRNLYNDCFINFVDQKIPKKGPVYRNGFKIYKDILKRDEIIKGKRFLSQKIVSSKKIANKLANNNKLGSTIEFNDHLLFSDFLLEIFNSNIIDDIRSYLGNKFKLDHSYLSIFNTSNGLVENCGSSGLFHHDSVGHRIKMFIPINEEGTLKNPTIYLAGTNKINWKNYDNAEKIERIRIDNKMVEQHSNAYESLGLSSNDVLIFDTNGIHKGSYFPTKESRILIQFEFSSHKSNLRGLVGPGTFYMSNPFYKKFKELNLLRLDRIKFMENSILHLGKRKRSIGENLSNYI